MKGDVIGCRIKRTELRPAHNYQELLHTGKVSGYLGWGSKFVI